MPRRATERRQHERVPANLAMQLGDVLHDGAVLTTESLNISSGGLYCRVRRPIDPFTRVNLTLVFPPTGRREKQHMVKCKAVVVRCEPDSTPQQRHVYSVACAFTEVSDADREVIEDFVNWRALRKV
jgi:c-di-GMP-binding flagellar brake protein YcgR